MRMTASPATSHGPVTGAENATLIAAVCTVVVFFLGAWLALAYSGQALLGSHAFRQTQTALTAYSICQDGFHLAYWTPVGGYPWSIPFEFPIYQFLVSTLACWSGIGMDRVGRLLSYALWIACLFPAWQLSKTLFASAWRLYFWTFSLLFLSAPLYLFWARSFLIESAALLFCLLFVSYSMRLSSQSMRWRDVVLTGLFLMLAMLQKITTVAPLLPLMGAVFLWHAWPLLRSSRTRMGMLARGCIAYALPCLIALSWYRYSDHVKAANALGRFLTSDQLTEWYGTLDDRASSALWVNVIWRRVAGENIAGHLGAVVICIGMLIAPTRRKLIALAVALFLLYFIIFEKLLFVHEYYPFSNTVYLIFALAVAVCAWIEYKPTTYYIPLVLLLCIVSVNLYGYFTGPWFREERHVFDDHDPILLVSDFLQKNTDRGDPLLIYGVDWGSQIPYYSQRRAFAVPTWFSPYLDPLSHPEKYLDRGPSSVVVCAESRMDPAILSVMKSEYASWPKAAFEICDVYLRK